MTYIMSALGIYIFLSCIWSGMFWYEIKRGQLHSPGWAFIFLWPLAIFIFVTEGFQK